MIPDNQQFHTLRALILKSQSESLSDSEIAQLNELMQSEGGTQEAAALIDQLCAFNDLGSTGSLQFSDVLSMTFGDRYESGLAPNVDGFSSAGTNVPSRPNTTVPSQSGKWTRGYWLLALVASYLLIASLAWSLGKRSPTIGPGIELAMEAGAQQRVSGLPQLVSMTACVWHPSADMVPEVGNSIRSGEVLNLVDGIAELIIGEGTPGEALVRIEGPASVFVLTDGGLRLYEGSLTVKSLGIGIRNVTVETPIGEVSVDGQSSIGIVSEKTVTEIHVFAGQAVVKPFLTVSAAKEIRLEAGEAVRFSQSKGDFGVVLFEASLTSFVSARSSGFDPLNLGEEYVNAVLDSKPGIYWRFEELNGEPHYHVANEGSYPNMDAVIIGEPGWRRYGENRVAELGKIGTSSAFRCSGLWPSKPLDEYTIEMWVKPELYHHGALFCLHESNQQSDGRYPHSIILETLAQHWRSALKELPPNRFRFVHRSPPSGDATDGSTMVAVQQYQVRTWQHLVAQKNAEGVSLWVDGRLSIEQSDPNLLPEAMQIVIGQIYLTRPERRFVGQIDEIAIYDRCLSPDEMRKHIEAAGRSVAIEKSD